MWTIGYTGQSPERLKLHMANQHTFDKVTLKANGGPCDGDYYGLPWPCWGTAAIKHPGTPNLYDTSKPVADGGLNFRVNWGLTVKGQANDKWSKNDPVADSLLAVESYPVGAEIKDGHPPVTMGLLQKMGWDKDLTPEELATIKKIGGDKPENVAWTIDNSGGLQRVAIKHGIAPFGNGKARCVVWNFPDGVPLHREPLYTNRRDLLPKYATHPDRKLNRLPLLFESIQKRDVSKDYPIILTSGRLVEYEGGGEEQRSNPWLAELQQNMFVEINPADANNLGIKDGQQVWLEGPEKGKVRVMAHGHRAGRQGRCLHAVPLRRPLPGQGPADPNILRAPTRSCWASRPTRPPPMGTTSSPRCRKPRPRSARFGGPRPWHA